MAGGNWGASAARARHVQTTHRCHPSQKHECSLGKRTEMRWLAHLRVVDPGPPAAAVGLAGGVEWAVERHGQSAPACTQHQVTAQPAGRRRASSRGGDHGGACGAMKQRRQEQKWQQRQQQGQGRLLHGSGNGGASPVCHQSWRRRVLSASYFRGPGTGWSPGRGRTMRGPPSPSARSAPVCPCHMYVPAMDSLGGWWAGWQQVWQGQGQAWRQAGRQPSSAQRLEVWGIRMLGSAPTPLHWA